jgi:hypothetical protein
VRRRRLVSGSAHAGNRVRRWRSSQILKIRAVNMDGAFVLIGVALYAVTHSLIWAIARLRGGE